MEKSQLKKHIEIEGVVLTEESIERLKAFQHFDNELAKRHISDIADTICYLELLCAHEIDQDPGLVSKARESISNLIDIREDLKILQKP